VTVTADVGRHEQVERAARPHGMVSAKSDGTPLGREEGTPLARKGTPQEVANVPCPRVL